MLSRHTALLRFRRAARWVTLRLRLGAVVSRACVWAPLPLLYGIAALTAIKVGQLPPEHQEPWLWGAIPVVLAWLVAVAHAWLRPLPAHGGAMALDRYHDLKDRITNALSFAALPAEQRTPLMEAAIRDAERSVGQLRPSRAAPLRIPREAGFVAILVGGLIGVGLLEVRSVLPTPPPPAVRPLVLSPDDVDLFREVAEELAARAEDDETRAAVRRFNQLLEDIADRRLDRLEVFRRLEELERDLVQGGDASEKALDEGLKGLARELAKSKLGKPAAEALEQRRLSDAEAALRKLADKLRNRAEPPSKDDLDRLRQAMRQASEASHKREQRLAQEREKIAQRQRRLLDKEKKSNLSPEEQRERERNKRELKRLDRQHKQAKDSHRQLSKLDRELAEAARQLMEQMGQSAEHVEAAAQDVNRMARQELSQKEKQELLRRLREMRELLRQQGKSGGQQMDRLMRFSRRAHGQGGDGQPRSGQGGRLQVRPGQGGQQVPLPGMGRAPGTGSGLLGDKSQGKGSPQPGKGNSGGQGDKPGGSHGSGLEAGVGHDSNVAGDPSAAKGQLQDVTAVAADTGEGEASSEVIQSAAERGFVGQGYRQVYQDYHNVAEEVIDQDEIPAGYRFYVRRYFQLIRPRE